MEEALVRDQIMVAREADSIEVLRGTEEVELVGGCSQLSLPEGVLSVVTVHRLKDMGVVAGAWAYVETDMPYLATFLSYREGPAVIKAIGSLSRRPDALLVPAAGVAHPRGIGMARHLGFLLSMPTVGVTKRPLLPEGSDLQKFFRPAPDRSRLFISRGWGLDDRSSAGLVRDCMRDHRLPEPIHVAKITCRRILGQNPSLSRAR
jgi:deoxyribonuclease V